MITIINKDLFEEDHDIIAHGCNCSGGFGSGVAGIIVKNYPWVAQSYHDKFLKQDWRLGEVQFVYPPNVGFGFSLPIIANVATQRKYGYDGKKYVTYTAIDRGMRQVAAFAKQQQLNVALPKIGCGLAGGDWNKVLPILAKIALDYPSVNFEVYYL